MANSQIIHVEREKIQDAIEQANKAIENAMPDLELHTFKILQCRKTNRWEVVAVMTRLITCEHPDHSHADTEVEIVSVRDADDPHSDPMFVCFPPPNPPAGTDAYRKIHGGS